MSASSSRSNKKDDGGKANPAKKGPSSTVKKTASSSSVTAAAPVRLCKLVRRPDFDGYGFGILVDEKSKLATVTTVEKGGPAEAGGLHAKDCILQVNGESVIGYSQRDVVDRIKSSTNEVRLLVTNKETVAAYKERGMSFSSDAPGIFRPSSATSMPLKGKATKEKSSKPPSPMRSRRGSLVIPIEEPSGSDNIDEFFLYGKEAKATKVSRPQAKNAKTLASLGPAATMSEPEQNLLQKHKQARTAAEQNTDQDRGSASQPSNARRGNIEAPEVPLNQPSTTTGRRSGNTSRHQVRWLSVRSPESTIGSPPISNSSQGNDYEAYLDGYMADAEDPFAWPSESYYPVAPTPFSASYGAHPTFPSQYEVPPYDPYNVLTAYHPLDFHWPQMAPYQGALMPVMSGPFYGYTSAYAPGYSDFFALYPGYASSESLHEASPSCDRPERQRVVREQQQRPGSAASTSSLQTSSSKSTKSVASRPSVKSKDNDNKAESSTLGEKKGREKTDKNTAKKP
ncbi:hypothetical protein MRX96_048301 [Rhipicephalus microplus]